MKNFAKRFRRCTLSLIANIYDHFNKDKYDFYDSHFRMINGKFNDEKDIKKWNLVHYLFDKGTFKLDIRKKMTANTAMGYPNSTLNKELNKLEKDNKPDKKRKKPLSKNERDAKRKKLDEKEISKIGFELILLRDIYHSRNHLVFDISEVECVLVSDPEVDLEQDIHPMYCFAPSAIAKSLVPFLSRRYGNDNNTPVTIALPIIPYM